MQLYKIPMENRRIARVWTWIKGLSPIQYSMNDEDEYRGERFKDRRYFKNSYKIQFSSYDQKSSELERSRRAGFKKIAKKS